MHIHVPDIFRLPLAVPFWLVFLWVWIPETKLAAKSLPDASSAQDAGTYRLIAVANHFALTAGFVVAFLPWGGMPHPLAAGVLGTAMLFAGGVLRRLCFKALGSDFTAAVKVRPDQAVVQHGPYRWVRHPSYAAGLLLLAGIGVALGSYLSVALLTLIPLCTYLMRIAAEEHALLDMLGQPYRDYMARTKRFIPFVY
jgi:protein-S-isoprenylcysteine O-methyltransferase Ste14